MVLSLPTPYLIGLRPWAPAEIFVAGGKSTPPPPPQKDRSARSPNWRKSNKSPPHGFPGGGERLL